MKASTKPSRPSQTVKLEAVYNCYMCALPLALVVLSWETLLHVCCGLQVDNHLRVVGHPTLFALGDVTDVPEEKLAFLAAQQGSLVAGSLAALAAAQVSGGSEAVQAAGSKLRTWRPSMGIQAMFVSIGRE